jgi:hypothetical protein
MVIAQEAAQSFAASNGPVAANDPTAREQQHVAFALVIPLGMVMLDEFGQGSPQGAFTEQDDLRQALLLH